MALPRSEANRNQFYVVPYLFYFSDTAPRDEAWRHVIKEVLCSASPKIRFRFRKKENIKKENGGEKKASYKSEYLEIEIRRSK